ncbi:Exosome complex component RRP43 [Camellia lanceoleosa]|uniref:Exosome complex component RRP43 n=1 Tax=Camellia lanceoleosa TaxID=1840588 RepID=A0ACC0G7J8_9ERIC|nr:Exosome complex component RRP43 [Camellia lanceoleosa]
MEVGAFRRLFPLRFHEHHLLESIRSDARKLRKATDTTLALGAVVFTDGSALAKIGCTSDVFVYTMLAAIKMEVMTPTTESPDKGCIVIDFHIPPICSPIVRPGRPADVAPVISKYSGMINFKELSLVSGKAAWMAYLVMETFILFLQEIYCLDVDGALFDAALLAVVVAFSHSPLIPTFHLPLNFCLAMQIPIVSLNDDRRVVVSEEDGGKLKNELINKGKRQLKLKLYCINTTKSERTLESFE